MPVVKDGVLETADTSLLATEATVAAIRLVTDELPNDGALTDISTETDKIPSVKSETDKIDVETTSGLLGTSGSVAHRAGEVETHVHSYAVAFEKAASASGEVHVADRIGDGAGAFRVDAGNDDWGNWVQILGSSDTSLIYDFHRISVESVEREATYFVQFAFGASGAVALTAGTYSDFIYIPETNKKEPAPMKTQSKRQAAGTKAWARAKCPGQNTAWLDFYHELHYYEG